MIFIIKKSTPRKSVFHGFKSYGQLELACSCEALDICCGNVGQTFWDLAFHVCFWGGVGVKYQEKVLEAFLLHCRARPKAMDVKIGV